MFSPVYTSPPLRRMRMALPGSRSIGFAMNGAKILRLTTR